MTLGQQTAGRDLKTRLLYLGVAMVFGLLVLAINLYRLQIVRGDEYMVLSEENRLRDVRLRAPRGQIRDRRGEVLADNRPSYDVTITPADCKGCYVDVIPRLAQFLHWDDAKQNYVESLIKAPRGAERYQPITVAMDLASTPEGRDQMDVLNAHLEELPGVHVEPVDHRAYRIGQLRPGEPPVMPGLAHVLGYMNEVTREELDRLNVDGANRYALGDYIGRRGIERYLESTLRGKDGLRRDVVDAHGRFRYTSDQPADKVEGNHVVLSIDVRLQQEAERAFPGTAGAVIVMDVNTGFILALVSRPSFDPNQLTGRITAAELARISRDRLQPMLFRPTAQHYSPGSTFKIITMLAAFDSGVFTPHSQVNCPGGYRLGKRVWRCWKDSGHGPVDAKAAIQRSCDTWFYKVADTIGLDPIAKWGKALGLGQPTGIGVVAEVPGIMPDVAWHEKHSPGGYTKGMALNEAIGQGDDNTTPLQLTMVYAALASGGKVYQPQLVRKIESPSGKPIQVFQPKLLRQLTIHPEHRKVIVDALVATVNEAGGTAYRSRLEDVVYAGKTGTAQVARLGAVRLKKEQIDYFQRDHAWFAAFAPAEQAEIAVVVLNEHGGSGSSDAAPTAKAVIAKYFELKEIDSSASMPPALPPAEGAPAGPPVRREPPPPAVPSMPPQEATRSLAAVPFSP